MNVIQNIKKMQDRMAFQSWENANYGLCLLAPNRQLLKDPKYPNMPTLYFLSTGAEISKITNPQTFGFQQCLDMLMPNSVQI